LSVPPEASVPTHAPPTSRFVAFLRSHPILCLAILTPGIPEYLSTSSTILNLGLNPGWFFLQLAINIGQYTAGALLIREAVLRWNKGWATVILLGLAYGITEEGLGDNTLFNSNHGADGVLGSFGRFGGVNWVWATGVLAFHVIYSIGLPILLLGLALPATKGRSLVGRRGVVVAFLSLAGSTSLETIIVYGSFHFWMGTTLLLASLGCIAVLVVAAYLVPADLWRPTHDRPTVGAGSLVLAGFAVFPILFFFEYYVPYLGIPAFTIITCEVVFLAVLLEVLRRTVGRGQNEYGLVNLSFGLVIWQAVFGVILTLGVPVNLLLVAFAVWFFVRLRRGYAPARPIPTRPEPGTA
jgi:hypothetical protein